MLAWCQQLLWRILAVVALKLALLGIPLPGLPTVPFILVAAWAAGKGWPELEARLLAHPKYGPPILHWRRHGAVSRRAKYIALIAMVSSVMMLWLSTLPLWLKIALPCFLAGVFTWLWHRPEPSTRQQGDPFS